MRRAQCIRHILLAVIVCMAAGCAGTPKSEAVSQSVATYQSRIRDIVIDPARADMLVQLVDQAAIEIDAAEAEAAEFAEAFRLLNADYDATKERFTALLTMHRHRRHQFAESLLSIRSRMVAGTTAQEWKALSKVRAKALETLLKAEAPSETLPVRVATNRGAPC